MLVRYIVFILLTLYYYHLLLPLSTFILAFVKSEGKAVKTEETTPLLSADGDSEKGHDEQSLSGDLRTKIVGVVRAYHVTYVPGIM